MRNVSFWCYRISILWIIYSLHPEEEIKTCSLILKKCLIYSLEIHVGLESVPRTEWTWHPYLNKSSSHPDLLEGLKFEWSNWINGWQESKKCVCFSSPSISLQTSTTYMLSNNVNFPRVACKGNALEFLAQSSYEMDGIAFNRTSIMYLMYVRDNTINAQASRYWM